MTIRELIDSLGDVIYEGARRELILAVASKLGLQPKSVRSKLCILERKGIVDRNRFIDAKPSKSNGGMTKEEYVKRFDGPTRCRAAIQAALPTIGDKIFSDSEFRTHCNASAAYWKFIRSEPEFHSYQWKQGDLLFWGSTKTKEWILRNVSGAKDDY